MQKIHETARTGGRRAAALAAALALLLGAAFAASAAGAVRTWLGDYQVAFISAGLLCLVASGLVIRIGRARRDQPALQAA